MKNLIRIILSIVIFMPCLAMAEGLSLKWGLQNTWAYYETVRAIEEDAAYHPQSTGEIFRTFAFKEGDPEVLEPFLECLNKRMSQLWERYKNEIAKLGGSAKPDRQDFKKFASNNDPACTQNAKRQAPALYFDFVADSADQYILEAIEITTLQFSEYKGGGFSEEEAWYDIVLSHKEGTKRYDIDKRLVFSGHGRCELRFWSDNYYENQGWISPMGEYIIDIKFIFSTAGKQVSVCTGPFKIDV